MKILRTSWWSGLTLMVAMAILWPKFGAAAASGKPAPEISGEHWVNSKPLTLAGLKSRVVLVEFWTYG